MAAKPITDLAEDLRKFVEEGRAQAGPRIVFALQHEGPWWTGTFGKSWKLSATKVRPVNAENVEQIGTGGAPKRNTFITGGDSLSAKRTAKLPQEPSVLRVPYGKPLYIGNESTYAGFATNQPGQTIRGTTYEQHADKYRITASGPDWYNVYTKGGKIMDDLTEGFRRAGASRL